MGSISISILAFWKSYPGGFRHYEECCPVEINLEHLESFDLEVGDEDRVEGFLVGYFLGNIFYVEFVFGVLGRGER